MHIGAWVLVAAASALRTEVADALARLGGTGDIGRVTESLNALVQSVADETKARLTVSHATAAWCEDTIAEKKTVIENAREAATQATADLQNADAKAAAANEKVEEVKRGIATTSTELSELEKKFDGKKAAYKEALKTLVEAQEEVSQSLLTKGAVVRTSSVDLQKLETLDEQLLKQAPPSFLQMSKEEVHATNAEDDMEQEKAQLDSSWAAEQKDEAKLQAAKKQELRALESDLETAQLTAGMAITEGASLTRAKASASRTADREAVLQTGIEASCEKNAKFNAAQETLRSSQTAKLRSALGLLRDLTRSALVQFASPGFLQLSNSPATPAELLAIFEGTDNAASAAAATATLGGQAATATALVQASASVSLDPLADIKAKIQGMLKALVAAENAEKGPANFCSDELASNRDKKVDKQNDADRYSAELRSAGLKEQGFAQTVAGASLGRNQLAAEKVRVEAEFNTETSRVAEEKKDHDLAIQVLDKAVSMVTDEFGTALLQAGLTQTSRQVDAASVTTALNAARDLFAQQSAEASSHLTEMETMTGTQKTELGAAVRARDQEISEAEAGKADQADLAAQAKESRQTATSELTSILTYLENLGQQCGPSLGNTYEDLKRQREEEIEGMQEALKVLEGEAVPALSMGQTQVLVARKPLTAAERAAADIGV